MSVSWEFIPLQTVPFVTVGLPIETWDGDQLAGAIVRVRATLPPDADTAGEADLAAATAYDCGARHVTFDLTVDRPARARAHLDETATVTDAFETWLHATSVDQDLATRLRRLHDTIEAAVA